MIYKKSLKIFKFRLKNFFDPKKIVKGLKMIINDLKENH